MSALPVYLDYAATTPLDPAVAAAMAGCLTLDGDFGNPSSAHAFGHAAAARVAQARAQVAALIGAHEDEIVFTSGATESNNLAILGCAAAGSDRGRHLLTVRTEHKAVLDPCKHLERSGFSVTYLTPDRSGRVTPEAFAAALRGDTILASVMCVNNEIGVLQEIATLAALCHERGIAFHSDCAQAAGKVPLDVRLLDADFLSLTAHKLYGPKGVGALYVRRGSRPALRAVTFGGGQERGLRPGTLATHQIVGLGAACERAAAVLPEEATRLAGLRERLWQGLMTLGGVYLNGEGAPRVPGILNVSFEGVDGESLVSGLGDLAVSTGAACNSESREPSYVLRALGRDARLAESSLRLSLGRFSRESDVAYAIEAVGAQVRRLRTLSPAARDRDAAVGPGEATVSGEGGGPDQAAWVRLELLVAGDTVKDARFRVLGCPHTLDVAAWLCERLRGRTRANLVPGAPEEWARARAVPVEKLGRLLLLEDALRACLLHWP